MAATESGAPQARQCEHHLCERRRKLKLYQAALTSHTGATIGMTAEAVTVAATAEAVAASL